MTPLPPDAFARPTLEVARALLGAYLVRDLGATRLVGRIVETEAYLQDDPAFLGWNARFDTAGGVLPEGRTADFFGPPGRAYVYRIYVTNWLLNVVTEPEGQAGGVLLRAVEPVEGVGVMEANRPAARRPRDLTSGPGKLTQAFGIASDAFHGADLTRPPLYLAEGEAVPAKRSARIGISRGVDRPYRFFVPNNPFVSPGLPSDLRLARRGRQKG